MSNGVIEFEDPELKKMQSGFKLGQDAAMNGLLGFQDLKQATKDVTGKEVSDEDLKNQKIQAATQRFAQKKEDEITSGRKTAAELYEEAKKKKNLSVGEALSMGALALVPSLIGYAVGGARGGEVGANVGAKASGGYFGSLIKEKENIRGITADQAKAAEERAKQASGTVDKADFAGFERELDLLAPSRSAASEKQFKLLVPDRAGGNFGEDVEVIRGVDGVVRYLDGTEIPSDVLSVAKVARARRPRVDTESGFVIIEDPFSPNGVRTLRRATDMEKKYGFVSGEGVPNFNISNMENVSNEENIPNKEKKRVPDQAKTRADFALPEMPGFQENFSNYDVGQHPRVKQIETKRNELEKQLMSSSTLLPGETPKQRDVRVKALDRQIVDLISDEDRQEQQLTKALEKAIDSQAVARESNRIISRLAGVKDGVNTGFISDSIGPILDKFDSLGDQERVRLRARTEEALSAFLKERSGAAVAEPEFQRLQRVLPGMSDSDEAFKTKLQEFAFTAENLRRRSLEGSGLFQFAGEKDGPKNVIESQEESIQQRAKEILERRRLERGQ